MPEATAEELAGYISGNAKRRQIVDVLDKNGSETREALEKLTRTPKIMLERALKDMEEKGLIKQQKGQYTLTDNGTAAATVLHAMR